MSTNNEIKDFDETAVDNKLDYRHRPTGDSQHQLTGLFENINSPHEINTFEPAVNFVVTVDEKTIDNDTAASNEIQSELDNRTFNKIDSAANINDTEKNENIANNTGSSHTDKSQVSSSRLKKSRKSIFISYSPDACYLEKRFIAETVQQLKENNLSDDIWFDKDEKNTNNPCWFSLCLEAAEKCRAALLFLSESYFTCPVSLYEGKILLDRYHSVSNSVKIFSVLVSKPADHFNVPEQFSAFIDSAVDLTAEHAHKSSAEKTSVVVGALMEELEKLAVVRSSPQPLAAPDAVFTGEFKKQKICQWSASDLQEWLFSLGIKEFYRQSLAEASIDGFLLMSLTDHDLNTHLGIDNRVVRKKIMQHILNILNTENKLPENWHLRARVQKSKSDLTYLIYDPADVRLAQNLKADLKSKNFQVIHHNTSNLGHSKEEFLETNGPILASASNVIVVVTEDASKSPFVFHEVLFADWLGKKIVSALFKNVWNTLRPSLRAVLGDCPAVDFETKMYAESLEILEHSIKPLRRVPGVVLEQTYLNKMADGLKPLESLVHTRSRTISTAPLFRKIPQVFISYQWDMQTKVTEIKKVLESAGFSCWADISLTTDWHGHSSYSTRSSVNSYTEPTLDTLQSQIQRTMKTCQVFLCLITPKYLQSDHCAKEIALADAFQKPIIPLLLKYVPAETAKSFMRKILLRYNYVDLSNDRLYKQNIGLLVERVRKSVDGIPVR